MAAEPRPNAPTLAVFASEKGRGDPERAAIMSQAGAILARRGARLICLAEAGALPVPLITGARSSGGVVQLIGDAGTALPTALVQLPIERIDDPAARLARIATLADGFVGLPGSLASASQLYRTWVAAGAGPSHKPVILLNRNRAFEVIRGLSQDVLSHSVKQFDRMAVFADSLDDLWNKVAWALGHPVD